MNTPMDKANAQMIALFKKKHDELFTDEEKKHVAIVIKSGQADLVGRDDLKKRLMDSIVKKGERETR